MHPPPRHTGLPIAFAHRGARAERRENTIEAFVRALELGATGLESDAWISADGQVVLDHDGVTGPPWRRRAIAALSRANLPAHLPTLANLYEACGTEFELSLDVKDREALQPILAGADAVGARGRLWLCDPDWQVLAAWRPIAGEAKLVESTRMDHIPGALEGHTRALRDAGIDVLNLHRRDWTAARVAATHQAGVLAFAWDAQTEAEITRLLGFGVDGVYSDYVDRLMGAVANRAPSPKQPGR